MDATVAAGLGVVLLLMLLLVRWKWRKTKLQKEEYPAPAPAQLVHRLCPHNNVVQQFAVEEKDSLDEHLDVLTRKLADKEGRLLVSKLKVRETQHEIESLHAIDHDMRVRYRELMNSLRNDLLSNEQECKRIQEQIEWVSRRRAEIRDEVRRGQKMYGEAAMELANNLTEMQRGRTESDLQKSKPETELQRGRTESDLQKGRTEKVTDKPLTQTSLSSDLRHRKEPMLPRATPISSIVIKASPRLSEESVNVSPQ